MCSHEDALAKALEGYRNSVPQIWPRAAAVDMMYIKQIFINLLRPGVSGVISGRRGNGCSGTRNR